MAEGDASKRSTAARVVDDRVDDPLQVAVPFAVVKGAEARRALAVVGVVFEHGPAPFRCDRMTRPIDAGTVCSVVDDGGAEKEGTKQIEGKTKWFFSFRVFLFCFFGLNKSIFIIII